MKRLFKFSCLLIVVLGLVYCSKKIDYNNLEKSNYESVTENKEISIIIKQPEITRDTKEITLLYTNNSDLEYSYGKEPHLEVSHNNVWYVVPVLMKVEWIEISSLLHGKNTATDSISIKDYYGKLEVGTYRFIKEFNSNDSKLLRYIEFEIK